MRSKKSVIACIVLSSLLAIGLVVPASLAAYMKDAEHNGSYGEVYLRSYYHSGAGTDEDPYIITRPRHLYNLSRLQGLGVYKTRTVFKLGYDLDGTGQPKCYLNDTGDTIVPFMDMSACTYNNEPIYAIGSESSPFMGEFDGQDLEIKNLNVYADPQDAGLFGYTGHGSSVHNLFLDNITIHTLGYTNTGAVNNFTNLYADSNQTASAAYGTQLNYVRGANSIDFGPESDDVDEFGFDRNPTTGAIVGTPVAPVLNWTKTNNFNYRLLCSGDFLIDDPEPPVSHPDQVKVDLEAVFGFFNKIIAENEAADQPTEFPLKASSTASLIASSIDSEGMEHSRVVMSLNYSFILNSKDASKIQMHVELEPDHGNNIGLLIGHCDGSASNCYVHNGKFVMNNGAGITGVSHASLENHSGQGLIGLVGNTVHNLAAEESDAGTRLGKNIGIINFTSMYNDIVKAGETFPSIGGGAYRYTPNSGTQYIDALRLNGSDQYVTGAQNAVSFNGQRVIKNTDLGVFTVATDYNNDGMGAQATTHISETESMVKKTTDLGVNASHIYYATGEYNADNYSAAAPTTFADYLNSLVTNTPTTLYPGHHLPKADEITSESFAVREMFHNCVFRFATDAANRTNNKKFYFSKLDTDTVGGAYLMNYFHYKLRIDGEELDIDSAFNGVMLHNPGGDEISELPCNFATPDLSNDSAKMWNIYDNQSKQYYASDMINFEIKVEEGKLANVTVVASQSDVTKPAALGVYRIDGVSMTKSGDYYYFNKVHDDKNHFMKPDYAFFMPANNKLTYYDYVADEFGNGQIGVLDSEGEFSEAVYGTEAMTPGELGYGTEQGYTSGKPRLYAHTFLLPAGRYCFGSVTGSATIAEGAGAGSFSTAKIHYVCAQGQDQGTLDFNDNTFASNDAVDNIDFLKKPRFEMVDHDDNPSTPDRLQTNIIVSLPILSDDSDEIRSKRLFKQRCYVALRDSKPSTFASALCSIAFTYDDSSGVFKITAPSLDYPDSGTQNEYLAQMTEVLVNNYGASHVVKDNAGTLLPLTNIPISLFGGVSSTATEQRYPAAVEP